MKPNKTPIEDLRRSALDHYDKITYSATSSYFSEVPRAINFYYDYQKANFWGRLKILFKTITQ